MIPVEIVVTFIIAYLVARGIYAHVKLRAARARITELEHANADLTDALLRAADKPPLGPG
jgi:predicted cation transporter